MTKSLLLRALEHVERKWPPAGLIERNEWGYFLDGPSRKRFNEQVIFPAEKLGLVLICRQPSLRGRPRVMLRLHPGIRRGIFRHPPYSVTV